MHMADGSQRTDYMAMEELKKRAQEHIARGDQTLGETRMLVVKFDTNFDRFAANVAYELRHLVVYRTDGGNFARGLVRQTGQLANFHRELLENSIANGTRVSVAARLYRRANPDPTLRWMMSVQFGRPVIAVSQNEGGQIYASPAVANSRERISLNWFSSTQRSSSKTHIGAATVRNDLGTGSSSPSGLDIRGFWISGTTIEWPYSST